MNRVWAKTKIQEKLDNVIPKLQDLNNDWDMIDRLDKHSQIELLDALNDLEEFFDRRE